MDTQQKELKKKSIKYTHFIGLKEIRKREDEIWNKAFPNLPIEVSRGICKTAIKPW